MIESLLSFSIATVFLAISPGPDNIYVLSQSLAHGWKSGLVTTAGLITGCIIHISLLAFGVSALIAASPTLFYVLKILGAGYLLWLAFRVYKSPADISISGTRVQKTSTQLFRTGFIMNLVNPKVLLFFLAFFPAFIWNEEGNMIVQFYILGLVFMLVSFVVFGSVAVMAGSISRFFFRSTRSMMFLKWLQIGVFIGIALYIISV